MDISGLDTAGDLVRSERISEILFGPSVLSRSIQPKVYRCILRIASRITGIFAAALGKSTLVDGPLVSIACLPDLFAERERVLTAAGLCQGCRTAAT